MIINMLRTTTERIQHLQMFDTPLQEIRKSGRSSGAAMHLIGRAMLNPGTKVGVYDHFGGGTNRDANRALLHTIKDIKTMLGFDLIHISWTECSIQYQVFKELPNE